MTVARIVNQFPLTPMQQGMLFHSRELPSAGFYLMQLGYRLQGKLRVTLLREAWEKLVSRHELLRARVRERQTFEPVVEVLDQVQLPWASHDWRGHDPGELESRLADFLRDDRARGIQFSQAPLMRVALFRVAAEEHVLVWTYHHLLADGRAREILQQELWLAYSSLCHGCEPDWKEPRSFGDVARWYDGLTFGAAEPYWRRSFEGFGEPTMLASSSLSHSLSGGDSGCAEELLELPVDLTGAVESVAARCDATPNTLLQAAWGILVGRYTGREEAVFGVTRTCHRSVLGGAADVVGLLLNTLPTRVPLPRRLRVSSLLREQRARWVEGREHENVPLPMVPAWSGMSPGQALFDSIFAYEREGPDSIVGPCAQDLQITAVDVGHRTNYPLAVTGYGGRNLTLEIQYQRNLFDEDSVRRMLAHLGKLVEGIVDNPEQRVSDLDMLTARERHLALEVWNDTTASYPRDRSIHGLFEEQAERTPDGTAVAAGERRLTYGELDSRANQLAHHLRSVGVGEASRVGLCVERSPEMLVGMLAILKVGGAYVPLDPDYPSERLRFMIEDADLNGILTMERLVAGLPPTQIPHLCLDRDWPAISRQPRSRPSGLGRAENLAYVIYTSGSTGRPKGVAIRHTSLVNLVTWHQRAYDVTATDRASQVAALSFDASVWEIWPYLTAGATIFLPDSETRGVPSKLAAWMAREGITICFLPTPLAEAFLDLDLPGDLSLRVLLTGGDVLRRRPRGELGFRVHNHYGPTESTVVTTSALVSPGGADDRPPSIGKPIANLQTYILDRRLRPVPVGVPGELYIGGDGLAVGYLERPALTAERFVPNPFSDQPGALLYRSGDLASYRPDGNIDFHGRLDDQVKIRGFRVEPGEIAAVVGRLRGVREVVVTAREDLPGHRRLVAYVVTREGAAPDSEELRRLAAERLPTYMVPSAFVLLDELPLTPGGKVDRRALPPPGPPSDSDSASREPRTAVEELIADIFAQVLGCRRVGVEDDFFALGGHSLLATQVASRVRDLLGVDLPLSGFFSGPTAAALARLVEAESENPERTEATARAILRLGASSLQEVGALLLGPSDVEKTE